MRAGTERAVAATKSYTAELLSLYLLFAQDRAAEAAARLPEAAARTLALTPTSGWRRSPRRSSSRSGSY